MMKRLAEWFNNHSLRFKMVVMLFAVVLVFQAINGLIFTHIVSQKFEENISEANLETVKQMAINLNRAMEDIVNEMVPIRDEVFSAQMLAEGGKTRNDYVSQNIVYQDLFNRLISADDNYQFVHSMLILDENSSWNYSYVLDEYLQLNQEELFQKALTDNEMTGPCQWSSLLPASYYFLDSKEEVVSIMMPIYRYSQVKNLLIVNLKAEAIRKYLEQLGKNENTLFLQISGDHGIFGLTEDEQRFREAQKDRLLSCQNQREVRELGEHVVMSGELSVNQWRLSMITDKSNISSSAKVLSQYIVVIIFSTGIVLLICVSYIVFIVTKPIQKMTQIMEANRHTRQISHRFHSRYRDEVGVLAETYNHLMDEIQQLLEDVEKEQIQSRKTYLRMLQLQIKPHFLYNTLEAAKFLVEMGDPKSMEMMTAIGKYYKLSLSGIYDRVKVSEEMEHLTSYLQILKLRYSSKYDYAVKVDPEILENEIVKFSLQPLVENAVYHGIKQQRKKGYIKILGYQEARDVVLVVWDDGAGIGQEKLEEIQQKLLFADHAQMTEHIGVINVHQRIRIQYGAPYGVSVESEQGAFTRVEVRIPWKKYKEEPEEAWDGEDAEQA